MAIDHSPEWVKWKYGYGNSLQREILYYLRRVQLLSSLVHGVTYRRPEHNSIAPPSVDSLHGWRGWFLLIATNLIWPLKKDLVGNILQPEPKRLLFYIIYQHISAYITISPYQRISICQLCLIWGESSSAVFMQTQYVQWLTPNTWVISAWMWDIAVLIAHEQVLVQWLRLRQVTAEIWSWLWRVLCK